MDVPEVAGVLSPVGGGGGTSASDATAIFNAVRRSEETAEENERHVRPTKIWMTFTM